MFAYFDESERTEGGAPICVGGFLFTPSGYKKFRRYWQSNVLRLRGRQFKSFHMTDLCAGHGEYKGLAIPDRVAILEHALLAVSTNAYGGIGAFFQRDEFEQKAPPNWAVIYGSIYTVACSMCLYSTGYWLGKWGCQMNVLYTFERGHKFQYEADDLLTAVAQYAELRRQFRYRHHVFEDKSEVGLQSADLFAWIITKAHCADGTTPRAMRPFVDPIVSFSARLTGGKSSGRFRLQEFVGRKLDQFLSDSAANPILLHGRRHQNRGILR